MDAQKVSTTARVSRWTAACLACLLAVLLVVTATAAIFVRQQFFDTDNFVGTTSQLAREKIVRDAVEKAVMDKVDAELDTGKMVDKAAGWMESKGAPAAMEPLLEAAAEAARDTIEDELRTFLASDRFMEIWDDAVRRAHTAAMSVIRGTNDDSVVRAEGTAVTVDLGEVVAQLKQRLLDRKFELAEQIPEVDTKLVLVDDDVVPQARHYAELIELAADWLPWVAVILLVAGLVAAPDRRRGALIAGVMLTVLAGVITVVMVVIQDDVSAASAKQPAVPVIMEAFTGSLRDTYLMLTIVGAVIALAAWFFGPSRPATRLRGLGRRKANPSGGAETAVA